MRRTWPPFTFPISLQVRRVGGDAVISFGAHPLYNDLCDQARTFGVLWTVNTFDRSGEPRQSLPMNDGRAAGTLTTLRSRSGLTSYLSLIFECLGRYLKKLLGREV